MWQYRPGNAGLDERSGQPDHHWTRPATNFFAGKKALAERPVRQCPGVGRRDRRGMRKTLSTCIGTLRDRPHLPRGAGVTVLREEEEDGTQRGRPAAGPDVL